MCTWVWITIEVYVLVAILKKRVQSSRSNTGENSRPGQFPVFRSLRETTTFTAPGRVGSCFRSFPVGRTPHTLPPGYHAYHLVMAESRFLRGPQSAAPPPSLNPKRTKIPIDWMEGLMPFLKDNRWFAPRAPSAE